MENTDLLLTRHGETLENKQHILQGQLPGTLSPLGKQQAEDLANRLEGEILDAIVCSDLARSYDTAMAVAARRNIEPQSTPLLREMDWGVYTGETLADVDWWHLPASVESVEKLYHRAGELIIWLKGNFEGKKILVVGHGAFNRAILTYLQGGTPHDMINLPIMENTEIVRMRI